MNDQGQQRQSSRMLIVSGGIFISRILGLVRDIVFAYVFGTGTAIAAFVIAFTFPNMLRQMFGEGAFSHAMVPIFSSTAEREGKKAAWRGACSVISTLLIIVAGLTLLGSVAVLLFRPFAPGELSRLTMTLLPWLLPYAVLICGSAALAAVLNSIGRFALPAYSQSVMNLALIAGAAAAGTFPFLGKGYHPGIWFLVGAVLLAGTIQFYLHLKGCRNSLYSYSFIPNFRDPMVSKVARLMAPAMIGAGVMQLNIVADRVLAGWLGGMATSSLYYSQRLVYLPVGLFGVALGIVSLPAMSRAWARKDKPEMSRTLDSALRQVLFLAVPAAVILGALRQPIIKLLFEGGGFTAESTAATIWALIFYLPGIPLFAGAKIAVTPFYARHDTRTPMRVAAFCLVLNIILNLILMQFLEQGGLALSTTICSYINVAILLIIINRELGKIAWKKYLITIEKIAVISVLTWLAASFSLAYLPVKPGLLWELTRVAVPVALSGLIYLAGALILSCPELKEIFAGLRGRSN